jgi:ABC-type glycerol-3-phosphate transport system substrate-binding protein
MKFSKIITIGFLLGLAAGCATTTEEGEKVALVSKVNDDCKNLGPVTVSMTFWGIGSEYLAVLKNYTAEKGGNTLVQTSTNVGIAYFCPEGATRL